MPMEFAGDYIRSLASILQKPDSRLYWGCLVSTLLFLLALSGKKRMINLKALFHLKLWTHPSSLLDMRLIAANTLFKLIVLAPFGAFLIAGFAAIVSTLLSYLFTFFALEGSLAVIRKLPTWLIMSCYSLSLFVASDFARFYLHRLQHKIPWLWCFHQVHHSALVLTPLTLMRTHPVDILLARLRDMLSLGTVNGIAYALVGAELSAIEILGVNAFGFAFNALGANLRHSHAYISFGPLESFFISPAAHQIHHSDDPRHFDKNFGVCLSLWDRLFASHYPAPKAKKRKSLRFGLKESRLSDPSEQKLLLAYALPFVECYKAMRKKMSV